MEAGKGSVDKEGHTQPANLFFRVDSAESPTSKKRRLRRMKKKIVYEKKL
jgi:hypothetical protein